MLSSNKKARYSLTNPPGFRNFVLKSLAIAADITPTTATDPAYKASCCWHRRQAESLLQQIGELGK